MLLHSIIGRIYIREKQMDIFNKEVTLLMKSVLQYVSIRDGTIPILINQ